MKKTLLCLLAAFLVIMAVAGLWLYGEYQKWQKPWGNGDEVRMVDIPTGQSAQAIAGRLYQEGLVPNKNGFLLMAHWQGFLDKLKAGEYRFTGDQTPMQVLEALSKGSQYYRALFIPEGFTQPQIALAGEEQQIHSATKYLSFIKQKTYFDVSLSRTPAGGNPSVEGMMFPDTYYFTKNTPPETVYQTFQKRFEAVVEEIMSDVVGNATGLWWQDGRLSKKEQIHRWVILASIIEKEAGSDAERAQIASVFVNRLQRNMPLQSDATVHYALNQWSRPLTRSDLEVDSPYNTYMNQGLPPAAICNPGRASLEAAAKPAQTDYLYFIADSNGKTSFASSYREHINRKNRLKRQ